MIELAKFEKYVIRETCQSCLSRQLLDDILNKGADNYDYTGYGYYISIKHGKLPEERHVLSSPPLSGRWNGIQSGFIIFIEDGELTLECFPYGEEIIPPDYRDQRVEIGKIEFDADFPGTGGKVIHWVSPA